MLAWPCSRASTRAGWPLVIVATALAARLAYLALVYRGEDSLFMPDSAIYLDLARLASAWLESGAGDWMPDSARMPLYPLFLAMHALALGTADPIYPVITQLVIDSLACLCIAALAGTLAPRLFPAAGLVAALNPTQIVFAALVLTDSLFFALVCVMLLGTARWLRQPGWGWALVIGLAGAGALLTRAVVWPFLIALPLLLLALLAWKRRVTAKAAGQVALASMIAIVAAAPVLERNTRLHDAMRISSQNGDQALFWIVPLVREAKDGTPWQTSVEDLQRRLAARHPDLDRLGPFAASDRKMDLAREELARLGVVAIAKAWAVGAAINAVSPAAILSPPIADLPRTGFYATQGSSKIEKIWNFLAHGDNPLYGRVLVAGTLGSTLVIILAVAGALIAFWRQPAVRPTLAFLTLWAGYVLLISGPVASAKYRLPLEPLIVVLVAIALTAGAEIVRPAPRPSSRASIAHHGS